ncbi:hypothetical protein FVE67_08260 [Thermosulfurimonas marina]|uniref:Periplasmic chaperone PpiD n=1 Tax=Thermosulfurimonas marina TaxID=2047767 RepID=A0A6H1WUA5_9BACT|nr:SurA N-terminal domain-containing protein [Thermosulfurimonas marina]QJA06782.1 hypothetical protein FVE67_08260 [Thermosulfurimonas marina]
MLDFLRKGAQSTAVKILFAIIILVFVFWGVGTFRASRVDVLATVNGRPITVREYQTLYEFRYRQLRQMFGESLNDEFLEKLHFREQVLEELVKRRLLEEAAERMGLSVHPEEVRLAIAQLPAFQEGGRFSFRRYRAVLRDLGLLPKDFEENVRADLLEARIKHFLTAAILAPTPEVEERYRFENQKLTFSYAAVPYESCEGEVKASEKELKAYFEEHRSRYRAPSRIKLVYLLFPYREYEKGVSVTEEELRAYYESEKERFMEPEARKVREIFVRARPGKKAEALKEAEGLLKKIKGPEDFKRLARKYSRDRALAASRGLLGWVKAGELFPAAEEAVFSAAKGEIVGPVEGPGGYYLFMIEDIRPAGPKPFAKVKAQLRKELLARKAREKAFEVADKIYQEAVLSGDLAAAARKEGLSLKETPFFTREKPAKPFTDKDLLEAALALDEGEISAPIEHQEAVYLFQVKKKDPERLLTFKEARKEVLRDFRREKAAELCRKKAKDLLETALKGSSPERFLKAKGYRFRKRTLSRKELLAGDLPQALGRALLGRGEGGWLKEPACGAKACYFARVLRIENPKEIDQKEFETLKHVLRQQKKAAFYRAWYEDLRRKARVKLLKEWPK